MIDKLATAVTEYIREAQGYMVISGQKPEIQASTTQLRIMLKRWRQLDKLVVSAIAGVLGLACDQCDHEGAPTGHNERDGFWMGACPTCGATK